MKSLVSMVALGLVGVNAQAAPKMAPKEATAQTRVERPKKAKCDAPAKVTLKHSATVSVKARRSPVTDDAAATPKTPAAPETEAGMDSDDTLLNNAAAQ